MNASDSPGRRRGAAPSSCRATHRRGDTLAQDTWLLVQGSCDTSHCQKGQGHLRQAASHPAGLRDSSACKTRRQHFFPTLPSGSSHTPCSSSAGKVFPTCHVYGHRDGALLETCPACGGGAGSSPDTQPGAGGLRAVCGLSHDHPRERGWAQPPPRSLPTEWHHSGKQPRAEAPRPLCHRCPSPEPPGNKEMQLAVNVRHFTGRHL